MSKCDQLLSNPAFEFYGGKWCCPRDRCLGLFQTVLNTEFRLVRKKKIFFNCSIGCNITKLKKKGQGSENILNVLCLSCVLNRIIFSPCLVIFDIAGQKSAHCTYTGNALTTKSRLHHDKTKLSSKILAGSQKLTSTLS